MTARNNNFACLRIFNIFLRRPAQNPFTGCRNHVTAFNNRRNCNPFIGSAIVFHNNGILRHINQTTCQVPGVRRFQSRIRQPFTRTVSRVEVFHHVQPLFKVRNNRCFNNFTRRFCHQPAHTSQLTHLSGRTARAGVSHHINGVHGFARFDF